MSDQVSDEEKFDEAINKKLGQQLKEVYSDVVREPVPARFLELLNQLENCPDDRKK